MLRILEKIHVDSEAGSGSENQLPWYEVGSGSESILDPQHCSYHPSFLHQYRTALASKNKRLLLQCLYSQKELIGIKPCSHHNNKSNADIITHNNDENPPGRENIIFLEAGGRGAVVTYLAVVLFLSDTLFQFNTGFGLKQDFQALCDFKHCAVIALVY